MSDVMKATSDRELLELAAKAAGLSVFECSCKKQLRAEVSPRMYGAAASLAREKVLTEALQKMADTDMTQVNQYTRGWVESFRDAARKALEAQP